LRNKWITQASLALVSKEWVETGQVSVNKISFDDLASS
jgi:hypothetical protein